MPVDPERYRPNPIHARLGEAFYDPVRAAEFPEHVLRHRNDQAAREVGLHTLTDGEWLDHFGRFEPLPNNLSEPLALRYHGHQFRAYNPDIGDGRGFLFAQVLDERGRTLDLGTKGSGTTPHSRSGDGRLTLKGAVRERLATEMLAALRVPTSRTLSIVETGEPLWRGDEPSPTRSAVLVRLQHSHIRIGTFQRLAYEGDADAIRRLIAHCAEHYDLGDGDPVRFLEAVSGGVARTGAAWWAAGFVHGVLNTDNINVTGESFDYGPWRFMEAYDPLKVAAYFDQTGLYAFARQPEALSWNLERLAECLLFAHDGTRDALIGVLERFAAMFEEALVARTHERLGLVPGNGKAARERVRLLFAAMRDTSAPHQATFTTLALGGPDDAVRASPHAGIFATDAWRDALAAIRAAEAVPVSDIGRPMDPVTMDYDTVERVWEAIANEDDWEPLEALLRDVAGLGRWEAALAAAGDRS